MYKLNTSSSVSAQIPIHRSEKKKRKNFMNISTPRNTIFQKVFLSKTKQIKVQVNCSTDPSHKSCNLTEADTHGCLLP